MQKSFQISSSKKHEIIDISKEVEKIVVESKVKDGLCNIYTQHATCAIIINENYDPSVREDILNKLNELIPDNAGYKHDKIDNNAAAHIKAAILGPSETIPIKDNKLELGTWQSPALCEFDGQKDRTIIIKILTN